MKIPLQPCDRRIWIKVCGFTVVEEACAAATLELDAIGLIFAPSRRRVEPEAAKRIARSLPGHIVKVGVFVDETPERILAIADSVGLDAAQLHGDESPATIDRLLAVGLSVIKAMRATGAADEAKLAAYRSAGVQHFLFDSWEPGAYGGTGRVHDWSLTAKVAATTRVVLAGGLTPANVADAVRQVRPWGVDVSSGVETAPGRKDWHKIKAFISRAREADNRGEERLL